MYKNSMSYTCVYRNMQHVAVRIYTVSTTNESLSLSISLLFFICMILKYPYEAARYPSALQLWYPLASSLLHPHAPPMKLHIPFRRLCTSAIAQQNRHRAQQYLRQFSPTQSLTAAHPTLTNPQTVKPTVKPTAKHLSLRRINRLLPIPSATPPSIITLLSDAHGATNINFVDVHKTATFADWMIFCTALSERHVSAVAEGLVQDLRALEVDVWRGGGRGWTVVDLEKGVVHIMTEAVRDVYDVERLWQGEEMVPE